MLRPLLKVGWGVAALSIGVELPAGSWVILMMGLQPFPRSRGRFLLSLVFW